jgi:hypothetical protein
MCASGASAHECGDASWTEFKDEKCYKLLQRLPMTQAEADLSCFSGRVSTFPTSTVLTIKSLEEQDFVFKWLAGNSSLPRNESVWLSAKRRIGREFEWSDGSSLNYSNWVGGVPGRKGGEDCVTLEGQSGLWKETACSASNNMNRVVCEKLQDWRFQRWFQLEKNLKDFAADFQGKLSIVSESSRNTSETLQQKLNQVIEFVEQLGNESIQLKANVEKLQEDLNASKKESQELKEKSNLALERLTLLETAFCQMRMSLSGTISNVTDVQGKSSALQTKMASLEQRNAGERSI